MLNFFEFSAFILRSITFLGTFILIVMMFRLLHFWWGFFPKFEKRHMLDQVNYPLGQVARGQKVNIMGALAAQFFGKMNFGNRNVINQACNEHDVYYSTCQQLIEQKKITENELKSFFVYDRESLIGGIIFAVLVIIVFIHKFLFPVF